MGATLTGTRISDTYDSLLKATDNGIITSSAKQITDGVGTNTPLYISTSRIGIGVSPTTTFQVSGNSKIGGDLTVTGNLLVEGTTTTVDTDTLSVKDPLIIVGNDNNTSDLVDLGFYGLYDTSGSQDLYAGLYRSASDTKFHLFKDLQEEPTTTVNTSGTGYSVATLVANLEGNVTGGTISGTTGTFSGNVDIDGTLDVDDVISVEGSAFGRIEIGGASGGYVDLKAPNSDDYDLRLITSVGGAELYSIDTLKFYTGATTDLAFSIDASQNATFENNVTIPETPTADTHAASKGYVDAAVEGQDTLAEILANGNTTGGTDISVSTDDDITFADDSKIILGDGSDVEMYWNGGTFVVDVAPFQQGTLITSNTLRASSGTHTYIDFNQAIQRFYSLSNERLQVNQTGVTVSGDLTVDLNTLFVDASANSVGINLTNPSDYTADELVISVPDGSGMTLVSGATDAAYIAFMSSTGAVGTNGGFVGYDHDADGFTMFAQSQVSIAIQEAVVAYFTDTAFFVDKSTTIDNNLTVQDDFKAGDLGDPYLLFADVSASTVYVEGTVTVNSSTATLNLTGSNTGASLINFADSDDGNVGRIYYDHTDNFMQFKTNDSERMRIDSSGTVQVRNTEPTIQLYNTDTSLVSDQLIGTVDFYKSDGSGAGAGVSASIQVRSDSSIGAKSYMAFHTDNGTGSQNAERMRIDSSGNVGIGTISPDRILHVESDSVAAIQLENTTEADSFIDFKNPSRTFRVGYDDSADLFKVAVTNFNSNALVVNSSGDVGIGQASPSGKLDVESTSSDVAFFTSTQATTTNVYITNSNATTNNTANLYFAPANNVAGSYIKSTAIEDFSTAANRTSDLRFGVRKDGTFNEAVIIDSSGDVSVLKTDSSTYSSTTPVADLILSRKNTGNTNNETVGIRFDVTGWSGSTTGGAAIEAIQPSNASSADLAFLTRNAGTWGERMRINSTGNVIQSGTSPQYQFITPSNYNFQIAVQENVSNSLEITPSTTAGGTTFSTPAVVINSSGNVGIGQTSIPSTVLLDLKEPDAGSDLIIGLTAGTGARAQIRSVAQSDNTSAELSFHTVTGSSTSERMRITSGGEVLINKQSARGSEYLGIESSGNEFCNFQKTGGTRAFRVNCTDSEGFNTSGTTIFVGKNGTTNRSINAGGTINASGADYAEYMNKAIEEDISKGDIVGVNSNGELTNIFNDSISFVVKSTNPSYVGGDTWGVNLEGDALEEARLKVDRIAFSGQVPCNVYEASVGDYIIPINNNGKISAQAISNPTFDEYKLSVGKVWKIMEDGRAWIAVKIA